MASSGAGALDDLDVGGRSPYSVAVVGAMPHLHFASPRGLPRASSLAGRVVVLDIAFAATAGGGVSFAGVTKPFIDELGNRLAAWVDHHDHDRHADYADDPRFLLATKREHGACPEMVDAELVRQVGPIDTIVTHLDLDGLYSAAKWVLGGREPYRGADDDAYHVDTRIGVPGPIGARIDRALRARFRDQELKRAIVNWLVDGMGPGVYADTIAEAAAEFEQRDRGTQAIASGYAVRGRVAFVDVGALPQPYDKTDLLLVGQQRAPVAVVRDSGMVTVAASFDSGWNFVRILGLDGGMPTRVTVPESRLDEVIEAINAAELPIASP